jgi:hypothetical protein
MNKTPLALALACWLGAARAQDAGDLARRVDQLVAELAAVKAQLAALKQAPPPAPAPVEAAARSAEPATVITSYGELNLNRPTHASEKAQADLRRFVLGFQHRFDERSKLVTEIEVEHAVSSASDAGEVEIEQAYIERQLGGDWALRAGLFLMPSGLLNENHEPTVFYGVERNFVETAIIPSTWREGGAQFVGSFGNGITVQTGVSTGFDLSKWDAASDEGRDSPLGAVHQELSLARAKDLSVFSAVNWRGLPGLLLGGSLFSGGASQGQLPSSSRVTLWEGHARWTPGRWDLAALYARGSISNTAALNAPRVGSATLIPATFDGGYLQAAYRLWSHEDTALSPFVRWERYDTARRYADLGPGLTPAEPGAERVATAGVNLAFGNGLVLKADLQRFARDGSRDRFDLGLGWSF